MRTDAATIGLLLFFASSNCLAGQSVSSDRLIASALVALQARSAGLQGEMEFVPHADLPASHFDGDGQARIEAGEVNGAWPRRRVGVPVQVWVDERLVQSRMVWFTVHWWQDVPVYARSAQAGERADSLDLQVARTDLAGVVVANQASAIPEMTASLRLRRAVRAGQPVLGSDFESVPAVARRDRVVLTVREGPVELRTTAIAQGDGEVGGRVNVLPEGADHWVRAKVTARSEVAVEE